MTQGQYPLGAQEGIVPCSDGAGEIISVSPSVKDFKIGDRVCPNFALDHIFGDIESETQMATSLGAKIDGCLTEVRAFPAYVSFFFASKMDRGRQAKYTASLLYAFRSTSHSKRPRPYLVRPSRPTTLSSDPFLSRVVIPSSWKVLEVSLCTCLR